MSITYLHLPQYRSQLSLTKNVKVHNRLFFFFFFFVVVVEGAKISGIDLSMRLVFLGGSLSEQLFYFFFFFFGGGGGGGGGIQ